MLVVESDIEVGAWRRIGVFYAFQASLDVFIESGLSHWPERDMVIV